MKPSSRNPRFKSPAAFLSSSTTRIRMAPLSRLPFGAPRPPNVFSRILYDPEEVFMLCTGVLQRRRAILRPMSLRALLLMSCVLCALAACGRNESPSAAPGQKSGSQGLPGGSQAGHVVVIPADSPQMKQIRVAPVQLAAVPTDELVAPARVTTNPNLVSRVLPPVQGRILRVMVKFGDSVEKGQPVMLMESPDADSAVSARLQAEATRRQARATLTKAETDVKRTTELYEVKAIAEKDMLQAQ